jgi:hypothetical protein
MLTLKAVRMARLVEIITTTKCSDHRGRREPADPFSALSGIGDALSSSILALCLAGADQRWASLSIRVSKKGCWSPELMFLLTPLHYYAAGRSRRLQPLWFGSVVVCCLRSDDHTADGDECLSSKAWWQYRISRHHDLRGVLSVAVRRLVDRRYAGSRFPEIVLVFCQTGRLNCEERGLRGLCTVQNNATFGQFTGNVRVPHLKLINPLSDVRRVAQLIPQ